MAMWFGGDYNPEQWDAATVEEDIRLMKEMHVNCVTLGVFSWVALEPEDGVFTFDWLEEIMDKLYANGIDVVLATPTDGMPFWLTKKFPSVMHTTIEGVQALGGTREKICPNDVIYRKYSRRIAGKLAERFAKHPALKMWHINNEYHFFCYCDECAAAFRVWLKERYGSLDALNAAWNTAFWGHTYTDFDQVLPPTYLTEVYKNCLSNGKDVASYSGMYVDYMRFMSCSYRDCIINEKEAIREFSDAPITQNYSDWGRFYDYRIMGEPLDVIAWDNYPVPGEPLYKPAFYHDLMRSIKDKSFLILEQNPGNHAWDVVSPLKRPYEVSDIAWQNIAHGADSCMFFQWRMSRGATEKFHGSFVPHHGRINTRLGRELTELGSKLEKLGDTLMGASYPVRVAMIAEWDDKWAMECSISQNTYVQYRTQMLKYYRAFYELGVQVDLISRKHLNRKKYDIVVAPCAWQGNETFSAEIKEFVNNGGVFLTTFFSGLCDESDNVILGGYPGAYKDLLGIWVVEIDGLFPGKTNSVRMEDGQIYECGEICDLIELEGARAIGWYGSDFYAGTPCVTEHEYGKGLACYVGTSPDFALIKKLIEKYCHRQEVKTYNLPDGAELCRREKDGVTYTFLLNHLDSANTVQLEGKFRNYFTGDEVSGTVAMQPRESLLLVDM